MGLQKIASRKYVRPNEPYTGRSQRMLGHCRGKAKGGVGVSRSRAQGNRSDLFQQLADPYAGARLGIELPNHGGTGGMALTFADR